MPVLVRDVMKRGVPTCQFDTPVLQVARQMLRANADAVVVVDDLGEVSGIISRTDIVRLHNRRYWEMRAEDIMTHNVLTIVPDVPVNAAAQLMLDNRIHQLVILHARPAPQRPVGILTMRDVIRYMVDSAPADAAGTER
ncbi:MAG: cyclic nucleotide-binding/CBS domain-containing protein [Anaerolineae bacterium]